MELQKILVAIDGSKHSYRVLEKAIEFAKLLNGQLVLVHCHKKFPTILGQPHRENAITQILYETERILKPFQQLLSDYGVVFSERVMEEPAGTVIPNIAEIEKCKMIVMGSRGLSDLEGLIVGSVTHRVLHLAHCPVLVVK